MIRIKDVNAIWIEEATQGYVCTLYWGCQTRRQFTFESHETEGGSGFMRHRLNWLCILAAVWNTYRKAVAEKRELQSLPGPWTLDEPPQPALTQANPAADPRR